MARELFRYWNRHPPVHELLAAFVGFKPEDQPKKGGTREDLIRDVLAAGGTVNAR